MTEKRFDVSGAARLDAPERLEWLPPAEVLAALQVKGNECIADIGAGTGYFSLPLADAVPAGKVVAVDVQAGMLALLALKLEGRANLEMVCAGAEATGLPEGSCNVVFLANIWHEIDDRLQVLKEAHRILGPGGRIAIVDWRPDVERVAGPPLEHRLMSRATEDELDQAGFKGISTQLVGRFSWMVQGVLSEE